MRPAHIQFGLLPWFAAIPYTLPIYARKGFILRWLWFEFRISR